MGVRRRRRRRKRRPFLVFFASSWYGNRCSDTGLAQDVFVPLSWLLNGYANYFADSHLSNLDRMYSSCKFSYLSFSSSSFPRYSCLLGREGKWGEERKSRKKREEEEEKEEQRRRELFQQQKVRFKMRGRKNEISRETFLILFSHKRVSLQEEFRNFAFSECFCYVPSPFSFVTLP